MSVESPGVKKNPAGAEFENKRLHRPFVAALAATSITQPSAAPAFDKQDERVG